MGKSKAKAKPNGFEEFYADAPVTPDDYMEEKQDLYSHTRPFTTRIQTCIQRYRACRKLDDKKALIFNKYLMLGGIETDNKAFGAGMLDQETLASATAEEIAAIQATDFVGRGGHKKYYDEREADKWVVDFEGVAKGYFSSILGQIIGTMTEQEIKLATSVIRNFLNYVLQHEVCPEYVEDVMAARRVCGLADKELWTIRKVSHLLPGRLNVALSTCFSGRYHTANIADKSWRDGELYSSVNEMTIESACKIINKAVESLEGEIGINWKPPLQIISSAFRYYEIETKVPAEDTALGFIKCKPWDGPGYVIYDVPDTSAAAMRKETFYIEGEIIELLPVGMKLGLNVHELDNGFRFFDFSEVYCSFYMSLENEKMLNYKEPVPNTRSPPTEDDPDAEEEMMEGEMRVE